MSLLNSRKGCSPEGGTGNSELHCPLLANIPYPGSPDYVEGDAWQWLWFVPHDPSALVKLFASPQRFVEKLEKFMTRARLWPTTAIPNPYYWAGNEPGLLTPWLGALAGRPDLTARFTRWVLDTYVRISSVLRALKL